MNPKISFDAARAARPVAEPLLQQRYRVLRLVGQPRAPRVEQQNRCSSSALSSALRLVRTSSAMDPPPKSRSAQIATVAAPLESVDILQALWAVRDRARETIHFLSSLAQTSRANLAAYRHFLASLLRLAVPADGKKCGIARLLCAYVHGLCMDQSHRVPDSDHSEMTYAIEPLLRGLGLPTVHFSRGDAAKAMLAPPARKYQKKQIYATARVFNAVTNDVPYRWSTANTWDPPVSNARTFARTWGLANLRWVRGLSESEKVHWMTRFDEMKKRLRSTKKRLRAKDNDDDDDEVDLAGHLIKSAKKVKRWDATDKQLFEAHNEMFEVWERTKTILSRRCVVYGLQQYSPTLPRQRDTKSLQIDISDGLVARAFLQTRSWRAWRAFRETLPAGAELSIHANHSLDDFRFTVFGGVESRIRSFAWFVSVPI